ncbi:MAG: MFS transporter [Bacillota bacterium]|nr:MFS transporter [Bacillota bacterium]
MGSMISSFREALRRHLPLSERSRSFLLFTFLVQIGLGMQAVTYNLWLLALGYPAAWLGRLMAAGAAAGLAGSLPLGWLARRRGAQAVLVASGGLAGLTGAASLLWPRPELLLAAAVAAGLAGAALAVLANPLMAAMEPPGSASLLFSTQFAVGQVAALLGSFLGGWLPARMAGLGDVLALRNALAFSLLLAGLALFPLLRTGGLPAGGERRPRGEDEARAGRAGLRRLPGLEARALGVPALLVLMEATTGAGAGLVVPYLNVFLVRRFGAGTGQVGAIFALGSVATALLALAGGRLARRVRPAWVGMGLQLLSLPLLLAAPRSASLRAAGAVLVLRSGLMNAAEPLRSQFAMESVREGQRTWLSALQSLAWEASWAASTAWAGPRVDRGAFLLLFQGTALAYAVSVALWLLLALRAERAAGGLRARAPRAEGSGDLK